MRRKRQRCDESCVPREPMCIISIAMVSLRQREFRKNERYVYVIVVIVGSVHQKQGRKIDSAKI